jgi:hypothetical protein
MVERRLSGKLKQSVQNQLQCHCPRAESESLGLNETMSLKKGKKLYNENFHSLYFSLNSVKGIISRKLTWGEGGFVESIQETRNAHVTVVRKSEETTHR